jgi:hypothetical protein
LWCNNHPQNQQSQPKPHAHHRGHQACIFILYSFFICARLHFLCLPFFTRYCLRFLGLRSFLL